MQTRMWIRSALRLCMMLVVTQSASSQDAAPSVFYPRPKSTGVFDASIGLRVLAVPRDISEEELNRAPALDAQITVGLPLQFTLLSSTDLQFITNQVKAGLRWSHCIGDFCVGAGDEFGFWFGSIDLEGFDNSVRGWMHYPHLLLGYETGDVRLSLRGEWIITLSERTFTGENELTSTKTRLVGWAGSFMMEQALYRNMHVVLGVRLSSTEFHHQTWFAFSAFKRKLLYSELLFAVLL